VDSYGALVREGLTFAVALVIAEMFYKFHSFSLECLAFLATWAALSALADLGVRLFRKAGGPDEGTS
jgi:hypothetical protein